MFGDFQKLRAQLGSSYDNDPKMQGFIMDPRKETPLHSPRLPMMCAKQSSSP